MKTIDEILYSFDKHPIDVPYQGKDYETIELNIIFENDEEDTLLLAGSLGVQLHHVERTYEMPAFTAVEYVSYDIDFENTTLSTSHGDCTFDKVTDMQRALLLDLIEVY